MKKAALPQRSIVTSGWLAQGERMPYGNQRRSSVFCALVELPVNVMVPPMGKACNGAFAQRSFAGTSTRSRSCRHRGEVARSAIHNGIGEDAGNRL